MINELQYKNRKKLKSWLLGTAVPVRGGAGGLVTVSQEYTGARNQLSTLKPAWLYNIAIYNHLTIHSENDMDALIIETLRHRSTLYLFLTVCWQHSWLTTAIIDSALLAMVDRLAIKCQKQAKKPSFWAFYTHFSLNINSFFSSFHAIY